MLNEIHSFISAKSSFWSGGITNELFISPKESSFNERNFDFRISTATVELKESDFTILANFKRVISPLDGELEIWHASKEPISLKPFEFHFFDGSEETKSRGKVRDFNLIYNSKFEVVIKYHVSLKEVIKKNEYLFVFLVQDELSHELKKYDLIEVFEEKSFFKKGIECFTISLLSK